MAKERGVNVGIIGISLLSVVGKIYVGIIIDRVRKVNTEGLIDDEQGRCVD